MACSLCLGGAAVAFLGAGRELISRGALMPSLDCREACTHRKQIANLLIRQRDRQIRTDAGRRDCPVGEFQLAEAPSTTPRLRLLVCCIRMPSIFRGVPSPQWRAPRANPQAAEATPGGFALAIAGRAFGRTKKRPQSLGGGRAGPKDCYGRSRGSPPALRLCPASEPSKPGEHRSRPRAMGVRPAHLSEGTCSIASRCRRD
jgi:hypothetical protein